MSKYGPPSWDFQNKSMLKARKAAQAKRNQNAMYSSMYNNFGEHFLRNNPAIDTKLKRLANRALFMMRREIPLGDARDGHIRNQLRVVKKPRGARRGDRDTYIVTVPGEGSGKWAAAVRRSSFHTKEEWQASMRAGGYTFGSKDSWINKVAKEMNRRG